MKYLTVRNLPRRVAEALQKERQRRGTSLNQTVIDLIGQALGVGGSGGRSNGLGGLGGTWTPEEQAEFDRAVAVTEQVDEELWR